MATYEDLIQGLVKDGYLKTPAIIDAFKAIDRKDFLPNEMQDKAYENTALPIGHSQTISQPLVVAFMLELLNIKPGEKILEIGTGSGWQTAIIAHVVSHIQTAGEGGWQKNIVSVERVKELHDFSRERIAKYGYEKDGLVELVLGDGSLGHPVGAPYDKIIAAASAAEMPEAWKDQLKIGGKIVAPVKESIIVLEKTAKDKMEMKEYFGFSFVPLIPKP
ncbi:MAG: protein-L-isoaspartate(D-aspartate) O-methyltransferase [Candidatus Pacebacteria bacterium]|nr:protein-L-isoaspartate(D-aspartate) O-methyltransferase [Candidatus Paceibacterota bacterium]